MKTRNRRHSARPTAKPMPERNRFLRAMLLAALCAAAMLTMAARAHDGPFLDWYSPWSGTTPTDWTAWTASPEYWQLSSTKEQRLPANGDCIRFTSSGKASSVLPAMIDNHWI